MQHNLQNHEAIVQHLKTLVAQEKEITISILHLLQKIECNRIDLARGHASLYKFCIHELGYSETEALLRIRAMRLLKSLPEVENRIQSGALSISNVAEVQNQFRKEDERRRKLSLKPLDQQAKKEVLCNVEKLSVRECQRSLAITFPEIQTAVTEKTKALRDEKTLIQFSASKELFEKIEKLKGLLAHKNFEGSYEALFEELADIALKKLDPVQRHRPPKVEIDTSLPLAPSVKAGAGYEETTNDSTNKVSTIQALTVEVATPNTLTQLGEKKISRSRYVPAQLRRKIWLKAKGRCEYFDARTGHRCDSDHALEIDHIHAFALGGKTEAENLRLLCDSHNRWRHHIESQI